MTLAIETRTRKLALRIRPRWFFLWEWHIDPVFEFSVFAGPVGVQLLYDSLGDF